MSPLRPPSTNQIDTNDVLFICGGAFAGLEHLIRNRVAASSIGFGANVRARTALEAQEVQSEAYDKVEPLDLVHYGGWVTGGALLLRECSVWAGWGVWELRLAFAHNVMEAFFLSAASQA
jgi:hypothetical protein